MKLIEVVRSAGLLLFFASTTIVLCGASFYLGSLVTRDFILATGQQAKIPVDIAAYTGIVGTIIGTVSLWAILGTLRANRLSAEAAATANRLDYHSRRPWIVLQEFCVANLEPGNRVAVGVGL